MKKDETNTRLHERLESVEKTKWNALDKFDIPLSMIHPFFKISEKMWISVNVKLFLEMDYTKLFKAKPIADVTNPLEVLAKVVISKKKSSRINLSNAYSFSRI